MSGLDDVLAGTREPGVYRTRSRRGTRPRDVSRFGWRTYVLDGRRIGSKLELLDACQVAFDFPEWFGRNWDALADSLRDLSWAAVDAGRLVRWTDAAALATSDPPAFGTALDVFRDACAFWAHTRTPMVVLVEANDPNLPPL